MIKLIASDLDGTLLPPHKSVPEETFPLIEKLYGRGVVFAPASGRQLPNLKKLFSPVLNKIAIIAENGGLVWYGGKVIYSNPTPKESVKFALDVVRAESNLFPLLSCVDCAYYEATDEDFIATVKRSYTSARRVGSLDEVAERESVIKISVWDKQPPCAEHGGPLLAPKTTGLRTIVSGYDWLDISVATANKGEALRALMKELGVNRSDCEAYGDHMNDYEMLLACGHPFVTANAFAGLKATFKDEIPSNADLGVIQRLKEHLK